MDGSMRERFAAITTQWLGADPRAAVVLAEISAALFEPAAKRYPGRVLNVGIREQLMIGIVAGLALEGMRPVAHSYAPFVVERPFESLKTDLAHQGLGAVLVSVGASYDEPGYGRTHACPEDVTLLDALTGWTVHLPGHPDEVDPLLWSALRGDGRVYLRLSEQTNATPREVVPDRMTVLRRGGTGTVIAVGPMLDRTLEAVGEMDVTVLYATTLRPFDGATLRATLSSPAVVLVEPLLAGTSSRFVSDALVHLPHRVRGLGISEVDLHEYGTPADHDRRHELDPAGLHTAISDFLQERPTPSLVG